MGGWIDSELGEAQEEDTERERERERERDACDEGYFRCW